MNFSKLLEELNRLKLPKDKFAVTSSGCLAVRGIREANDLDLIVTRSLWETLSKKYKVHKKPGKEKIKPSENIEIGGFLNDEKEVEEDIKNADVINGIRYVKLKNVIKFKKKFGREKDFRDIELINKFLSENKS